MLVDTLTSFYRKHSLHHTTQVQKIKDAIVRFSFLFLSKYVSCIWLHNFLWRHLLTFDIKIHQVWHCLGHEIVCLTGVWASVESGQLLQHQTVVTHDHSTSQILLHLHPLKQYNLHKHLHVSIYQKNCPILHI